MIRKRSLLIVIIATLLAANSWMYFYAGLKPVIPEAAPRPAPVASQTLAANILPVSAAQLAVIRERPLFFPARRPLPDRPVAAKAQASEQPLSPPQGYMLRGLITQGGKRLAVLEQAQTAKYLRLAEGETLDGWTVARIEHDRLAFSHKQQLWILEMAKPTGQ